MGEVCRSCGGDNPQGMRFCGHCGASLASTSEPTGLTDTLRRLVSDQLAERLAESGGEIGEERRLVTALFADVSGFTALADQLDPEGLVEAINPVIAALTDAAGRYDAYVSKFAGDALLCLFGAPVTHEDDADRALLAALDMRDAIAAVTPSLPEHARHLTLHVGVNTGHVVAAMFGNEIRTDYSVLGDAVNTAQRLESQAPSGEIFVGEATWTQTRDRFEFEEVGALTVKGKSEPVRAWRLLGPRKEAAAHRAPFVGRAAEISRAVDILGALASGHGAALAIVGDPGVGKSRLLAEIRGAVDAAWLGARCPSYGSAVAYAPIADLIRGRAGIARGAPHDHAGDLLRSMLARDDADAAYPYFASLIGLGEQPSLHELSPEALRRGLHDSFGAWLRAIAPVVLAIEDLHWADASTLALLSSLAPMCEAAAIGVIATGRPDAVALIETTLPTASVIPLQPLGDADTALLVAALAGGEATPEMIERVRERSRGNPFFVEEVVRLGDSETLPPTVEGVVSARIDRLPPHAASVLQIAAVIGRRVPRDLLHAVAGSGPADAAVGVLVDGGFLDEAGGDLRFHHALVQDVAYGRLLRRRQREIHGLVARAGERLYGDGEEAIEILARHLLFAGETHAAIGALLRAAERSRRLFANDEAIAHLERAEEAARTTNDDRLAGIVITLADVCELTGRYDRAITLYEEARRDGGSLRAWTGAAAVLRKRGEHDAALALAEEGLKNSHLDAAALHLERAWAMIVAGRYGEAIGVVEEGLAAGGSRTDRVTAGLLLQRGRALTVQRDFEGALRDGEAARQILQRHGDFGDLVTAMRIIAGAHRGSGRLEQAAAALGEAVAIAERTGDAYEAAACSVNLGLVELNRGDAASAVTHHRRAIDGFRRIGSDAGLALAAGNLARMLLESGDVDGALVECERALRLAERIDHRPTIADASKTLAMIELQRGMNDEAAAAAERAGLLYEELGMPAEAAECRTMVPSSSS